MKRTAQQGSALRAMISEAVSEREILHGLFDLLVRKDLQDGRIDAIEAQDVFEVLDAIELHTDRIRLMIERAIAGEVIALPRTALPPALVCLVAP